MTLNRLRNSLVGANLLLQGISLRVNHTKLRDLQRLLQRVELGRFRLERDRGIECHDQTVKRIGFPAAVVPYDGLAAVALARALLLSSPYVIAPFATLFMPPASAFAEPTIPAA